MVINVTKSAGRVSKEIALIVGHLLIGLILIVGRKVRADGKPKVAQLASWVKARSIIFIRKSIEVVKPLAIEAGQTSKALLIVTGRRLRTEGGPRSTYAAHLIKLQLIAFVRKRKEQQTSKSSENIVHDPSAQNYPTGTTTSKVSPEIILDKDSTLDLSDRLANEIKDKGITCHIVSEIGSIQFEEKSCYSHLFPMSPRIITNRGYIRLSDISGRNISLIQIIQRN
ncbi:hypothetical protein BH18THE2_BH18THE2_32630 [soil metagenome]